MPVALVKSLSSSTKALAGSHAAQHIVSDFPSACAEDAAPRVNASVPAAHARDRFVLLILIVRSSDFGRALPAATKQSRWSRFQSARCSARSLTFSNSRHTKYVN